MKIAAAYNVYDDTTWLRLSYESIRNHVDAIFFFMNLHPHTNVEEDRSDEFLFTSDTSTTQLIVDEICSEDRAFKLINSWEREDLQRNFALDYLKYLGYDFALIIDADEIYEFDHIRRLIEYPRKVLASAYCVEWDTYWKMDPIFKIEPRESFTPIVLASTDLSQFRFTHIRSGVGRSAFRIPPNEVILHHFSYSRSDSETLKKITQTSHASEIRADWYEKIWLSWTPEMQNLHPITPSEYQKAVLVKKLPSILRKIQDRKCSIVILNWNTRDLLLRCLSLIGRNTKDMSYELIIVDNGSTDGSRELLANFDCKKVLNAQNLGFAKGVNQGLELSERNDVCLLNVDAQPQKNWLKELYKTQRSAEAGLVGPLGHDNPTGYQGSLFVSRDVEIKNLVGYCLLIRREVIDKIGAFDEKRFEMGGFEDDDFCLRSNIAGFRNFISSRSLVLHTPHQAWTKNGVDFWEKHVKNEAAFRTKYWDLFLKCRDRIRSDEIFIPLEKRL